MSIIGFINQLITWRTSQEPLSDHFGMLRTWFWTVSQQLGQDR